MFTSQQLPRFPQTETDSFRRYVRDSGTRRVKYNTYNNKVSHQSVPPKCPTFGTRGTVGTEREGVTPLGVIPRGQFTTLARTAQRDLTSKGVTLTFFWDMGQDWDVLQKKKA